MDVQCEIGEDEIVIRVPRTIPAPRPTFKQQEADKWRDLLVERAESLFRYVGAVGMPQFWPPNVGLAMQAYRSAREGYHRATEEAALEARLAREEEL